MSVIGNLNDLSAPEISQILALGKKTGTLTFTSDDEEGVIYFERGQALDAVFCDLQGEEAVYTMLLLDEGFFEFESCDVTQPQTIFTSTESLILEAMRRSDEFDGSSQAPGRKEKQTSVKNSGNLEKAGLLRGYFVDYFNRGL